MVPEPGYQSQHSLISNLQERYSLIFNKMYTAQTDINRSNAAMYTNRTSPLKVGYLVQHWTKCQILGKPEKITNRWTGLFQVVEVLNAICVKIDSIHNPGRPMLTTIHHIQQHDGPHTGHFDNPRPDLDPGSPPEDEIETRLGAIEAPRPMGFGTLPQVRRTTPPSQPKVPSPLPPPKPPGDQEGSDSDDSGDESEGKDDTVKESPELPLTSPSSEQEEDSSQDSRYQLPAQPWPPAHSCSQTPGRTKS